MEINYILLKIKHLIIFNIKFNKTFRTKRKIFTFKRFFGLIIIGLSGYLIQDYYTERIFWRNIRTLKAGAVIIINYKYRFSPENVDKIHEETAFEIYNLCKTNDGLYVKFG